MSCLKGGEGKKGVRGADRDDAFCQIWPVVLISAHRGKVAGGRRWPWLWSRWSEENQAYCTREIKVPPKMRHCPTTGE